MEASTSPGRRFEPPGSIPLWAGFLVFWLVDTITAGLFFQFPHATETNPVTVLLYGMFGLPGVVLAAGSYATIVIAIDILLPEPADRYFLAAVVVGYVILVCNNVILLLSGTAPIGTLLGV